MGGLGKQGKSKARKRATDLAVRPPEDVGYVQPPPDECEESACYTFAPSDASLTKERINVRMVDHVLTSSLVAFAIIQETYDRGAWRTIAVADSTHDDEVHVHRYARRTSERVGEPERLCPIETMDDVGEGYQIAYEAIVEKWTDNKRRWQDA